MELLFAILSGFIINPTFDQTKITPKEKTTIMQLIDKSGYMKECSITGPVGIRPGIIVLGMVCTDGDKTFNARLGIDFKHKIYMRKRFTPSQWN